MQTIFEIGPAWAEAALERCKNLAPFHPSLQLTGIAGFCQSRREERQFRAGGGNVVHLLPKSPENSRR